MVHRKLLTRYRNVGTTRIYYKKCKLQIRKVWEKMDILVTEFHLIVGKIVCSPVDTWILAHMCTDREYIDRSI